MSRLIYALEFQRQAAGDPIVATSAQVTTFITGDGVTGSIVPLDQQTAVANVTQTKLGDGTVTEAGTITFGPDEKNVLSFTTVGVVNFNAYTTPDPTLVVGTVTWRIDSGTGLFSGATGAVTSNFIANSQTGQLTAYHFGVVYLPD
jgi:hypothetical protein